MSRDSRNRGRRIGVDIGGTWLRVLAEDAPGRSEVLAERTPGCYDELVDAIAALVRRCAAGPVDAACCGLPGSFREDRADFVPALPWLTGRPLGRDLSDRLECPVALGFDGHLTLLAEAREGAAASHTSAVLVAVGTGIGGAFMVGGRIWRGHRGTAGSWGWLPSHRGTDDPDHGGFEQVASGRALDVIAGSLDPGWDGQALVDAARREEPRATAALDDYAAQLGRGIAAIASVIDPELVILGGGMSAAMDVLAPRLAPHLVKLASPNGRTVPVVPAALGPHAGVIGAVHAALPEGGAWL